MFIVVRKARLAHGFAYAQMVVITRGRAHAVADIVQTITFCKLAEQHGNEMGPSIITLAVLVGLVLFNQAVERISTNLLENLRKKCDIHPEVGIYVFVLQLKHTGFVRNQLLFFILLQKRFGQV